MEKKKVSGERKRKNHSSEMAGEIQAQKKRKSVSWANTSSKDSEEVYSATEEHSRMLGLVTGKMKELPLEEDNTEVSNTSLSGTTKKRKRKGSATSDAQEEQVDGVNDGGKSSVDKDGASEYLMLWNGDRDNWSFRKKTQYWLLQNMYFKDKLSKSKFGIMLRYLVGLQGNQRTLVLNRANDLMKENEPIQDEMNSAKWIYKRARKVSLVLSC